MAVELITKTDLQELKQDLLEEIRTLLNSKTELHQKEWLKSPEVRKLLKISPGTLQNLRINGTLRFTKLGSIIFYNREDINKLLESGFKK